MKEVLEKAEGYTRSDSGMRKEKRKKKGISAFLPGDLVPKKRITHAANVNLIDMQWFLSHTVS